MFIPGPGMVGHEDGILSTRTFLVLGPIPGGSVVDIVRVAVSCSGAASTQVILVAAAIGSSSEASQVALNAGRSLIRFSDIRTLGPGTVSFGIGTTGGERRLEIPVGILIKGGPQWVVVGVQSSIASGNSGLVVSVSTLQKIGDVRGGEGREATE